MFLPFIPFTSKRNQKKTKGKLNQPTKKQKAQGRVLFFLYQTEIFSSEYDYKNKELFTSNNSYL